jgi:hypothetical protein
LTNQASIVRVNARFSASSSVNKTSDTSRTDLTTDGIVATADPTDPDLLAC